MSKTLNFYYSCLNNQGQSVYKCLVNDSDNIQTVECLDYRKTRNYSMNASYQETDEDLFKFRNDLKRLNDQIVDKLYHSKLSKKWFRLNVFNYNTLNEAVLNTVIVNADQTKLKNVPKIDFREFPRFPTPLLDLMKDLMEY